MTVWRALVGESNDDEEDFHGFTVEEAKKGLMLIVVQEGILQSDNELSDNTFSDNGGTYHSPSLLNKF